MRSRGSRKRRPSARGRRRERGGAEWIGGLLEPPFFVTDQDEPYRPGLVVWMDASEGLVVGQELVDPESTEGAVARVLVASMERPMVGTPHRPARIRVASARLASEIRSALGDATPIDIAPTPELDEFLEMMVASMNEEHRDEALEDRSYLEAGRVTPAVVGELFVAAEVLYQLAPWKVATDDQVLRMDIPALGVQGACVSIIGNLGESLGLLIFPSLAGYDAFLRAAEELPSSGMASDLGTDWLALNFERGAEIPAEMRKEVAQHGWPVAGANAYPFVACIERDGTPRPLVERDVKIASACASAFCAFFAKHRQLFEEDEGKPVCESYFDERDLEVRFTLPYEAAVLFGANDGSTKPTQAKRRVGRNDPCPCGSGKKYKKCHLGEDHENRENREEESDRAAQGEHTKDHDLDRKLSSKLSEYAMAKFGVDWRRFARDFVDVSECLMLAIPWSVYHYQVEGQTVLDWYLAEHGRDISRAEREWLVAQKASWLSVWEVIAVEPGETLTLRDLLSHEERCVREASGSQVLVVRDALLARVVDHAGVSLLCGAHPRPLGPIDAEEVVRRARGRLRRRRAVPVERLQDEPFGRYLIKRWEDAVAAVDLRAKLPMTLQNTAGDPLLLTTDHFALEPGARSGVATRLAEMEGVEVEEPEGPEDGEAVFVFFEPGSARHATLGNTVIGRASLSSASLSGATLRVETNSRARSDRLRAQIEAACEGLVRYRAREHTDPLSPAARAAAPDRPPQAPPPEVEQLMLDLKRRHYADWPDQELPALGGQTPREAVGTAAGRNAVDVLLKDMENHEQRTDGATAFDFGTLRRELGLD